MIDVLRALKHFFFFFLIICFIFVSVNYYVFKLLRQTFRYDEKRNCTIVEKVRDKKIEINQGQRPVSSQMESKSPEKDFPLSRHARCSTFFVRITQKHIYI